MQEMSDSLKKIEQDARKSGVPLMLDSGMEFLLDYIRCHPEITRVLECGTAVGWSSMNIAGIRENITIDTLEVDPRMYEQAVANIRAAGLDDRIFVHLSDASLYTTAQYYDLFFIDAAKSQYRMYLEHFFQNSYIGSVFVFDNLNFHGIVDHPELSHNRSTVQMTHKIAKFREAMLKDRRFECRWHPEKGDGILIARRISEVK